jgi:putative tryptophan/tyrosine transport system substrate-binding protein
MRRRQFIALLGGAAVVGWPLAARAQRPATPVIGLLSSASAASWAYQLNAFRQGLSETGYIEGQNVAMEYRWADGQYERLPSLAAELVRLEVAILVATGAGGFAAQAAKTATSTIPIVFSSALDPIKLGLVASINRPGGNATGFIQFAAVLEAKRLQLLNELVPNPAVIGVLVNPANPAAETQMTDVHAAARSIGRQIHVVTASSEGEFDAAFASLVRQRIGGLLVAADPFFYSRHELVVALAARHAIPAIYEWREFAAAGGLISYGNSITDAYRQIGVYAGRILKGANPADLPVVQPTKFELVINLKTAKALGLTVPSSMQLLADEVIE